MRKGLTKRVFIAALTAAVLSCPFFTEASESSVPEDAAVFAEASESSIPAAGETNDEEDKSEMLGRANGLIANAWREEYASSRKKGLACKDYLEVINTRIVHLKENDIEQFEGIDCIIVYSLLSDYIASSPYYINVNMNDTVSVMKSGIMVFNRINPIDLYRSRTYISDVSGYVESVENLGSSNNQLLLAPQGEKET